MKSSIIESIFISTSLCLYVPLICDCVEKAKDPTAGTRYNTQYLQS